MKIAISLLGMLLLAQTAWAGSLVGGPCRYDMVAGTATVVAVTPQTAGNRLDVTFTFAPEKPITNEPLYVPGKVWHLTLIGGQEPGPRFVQKYNIRPDTTLPSRMRVIREGTCTPVVFDFPGIDLTHDPDTQP